MRCPFFDVAQTDGKPIPELAAHELLSDVEGYQDMIKAIEAISPVPIELEEIAGDSKGYYDREAKRIAVQENQTLKTMIHEVAHSKLHSKEVEQDEQMKKDRNTKEVEAESVAYTVCQHFGIDSNTLASEAETLRQEKDSLVRSVNGDMEKADELQKLIRFVSKGTMLTEFDDGVFLEYVDKVTGLSRNEAVFELKCGLFLRERLVN